MARLRGRIDNTERLGRTINKIAERAVQDPGRRTRVVVSSGLPQITAADFANRQIVAPDFRTALNVGDTAGGVLMNSDGIEGYNASVTQTFDINTDGSGFLGTGATQISWGTTGTVAIPGGAINAGTIDELQLADEAVTNAKIAVNAVQGDVIAAGAITETKVGSSAISTAKLAAGAVTAAKIAAGTITATEIASNAITTVKINAGAVTSDKITVSTLSAISANMGSITAGTITSATIRTLSSGQRVEMVSQGLMVHGTPGVGPITQSIQFKSTADGSTDGALAPHGGGGVQVQGDLKLNDDLRPAAGSGFSNVGTSTAEFLASHIQTMKADVVTNLSTTDGLQIHSTAGSNKLGFFGASPVAQQTVSGARDTPESALANLLSTLATIGLIIDSTTAS